MNTSKSIAFIRFGCIIYLPLNLMKELVSFKGRAGDFKEKRKC